MPDTFSPLPADRIARRFGDIPPSSDEIADFEKAHGIGSYERCQGAERQARQGKFKIGISGRIEVHHLERKGLPSRLASAYVDLLYGPPIPAKRLTGPWKR